MSGRSLELASESAGFFSGFAVDLIASVADAQRTVRHDIRSGLSPVRGFVQLTEIASDLTNVRAFAGQVAAGLSALDEVVGREFELAAMAPVSPSTFSYDDIAAACADLGLSVEPMDIAPALGSDVCPRAVVVFGILDQLRRRRPIDGVSVAETPDGVVFAAKSVTEGEASLAGLADLSRMVGVVMTYDEVSVRLVVNGPTNYR